MRVRQLLIGGVLVLATLGGAAEADPPLEAGMRVRIFAPQFADAPMTGTIARLDEYEITVEVDPRQQQVVVPREQITRLERSTGPESRVTAGALGALGGALVGAYVGYRANLEGQVAADPARQPASQDVAVGAAVGALVGAVVGYLIPGDRWSEVPLSGYRVSFAPRLGPGGSGLAFSVAFGGRGR